MKIKKNGRIKLNKAEKKSLKHAHKNLYKIVHYMCKHDITTMHYTDKHGYTDDLDLQTVFNMCIDLHNTMLYMKGDYGNK